MKYRRRSVVSIVTVAPLALILTGYSISPGDNVHERMTMASKRCFDSAMTAGQKPTVCDTNIGKDLATPDLRWIDTVSKLPKLDEAVRWPDDPQRELALPTALKVVQRINKCKSKAEKGGAGAIDINRKLMCNSNFGSMQFFHAQASVAGEPAADTHFKIMHWAEFLFNVAAVYTDAQLDQPYCSTFSKTADAFSKAMLPDMQSVPCGDAKHPGWAIRTLFTTQCRNIFTSKRCKEDPDPERYNRARTYATAALLHLVQDSYSQSHCVRGQCEVAEGKVVAKVECAPIKMFTTYVHQQNHSDADRDPIFTESCRAPGATDDPVSAGAKILWDVRNKTPVEELRTDIEAVFGTAAHAASLPAADLGDCFKGQLK